MGGNKITWRSDRSEKVVHEELASKQLEHTGDRLPGLVQP